MSRKFRSCLSALIVACLLVSMCSNGLAVVAAQSDSEDKSIHYVSLGDSMANGYGFNGYKQDTDYDFFAGTDMYGANAYPLQFEQYLKNQGYDVKHTKLATSAMLPEHLAYLLRTNTNTYDGLPTPNYWGFRSYIGQAKKAQPIEVKEHFQNSIADADIITMGMGNATFGAYLMDLFTVVFGLSSSGINFDEITLEKALEMAKEDKHQEFILEIYNNLLNELNSYADLSVLGEVVPGKTRLEAMCDVVAFCTANYIISYEDILRSIDELNDKDLEVIIVGIMNTVSGIVLTDDNGNAVVPLGDLMNGFFTALNAYSACLPALLQEAGELENITFYYAEDLEVECYNEIFQQLRDTNWASGVIEHVDTDTVLDRTMGAVADRVTNAFGLSHDVLRSSRAFVYGQYDKIWPYDPAMNDPFFALGVYEGIELAVAEALSKNIPLSSFSQMGRLPEILSTSFDINALYGAFATGLGATGDLFAAKDAVMYTVRDILFQADLQGMCAFFGLFQIGNGLSVHPTPSGHDELFAAVIGAYEGNYTAADEAAKYMTALVDILYNYLGFDYIAETARDNLRVYPNSHYLALGDKNAYGPAADAVASNWGISYKNSTVAGQSAAQLLAALPDMREQIAQADLITLGFSANSFTDFAFGQLALVISGKAPASTDLSVYLGQENAALINGILGELKKYLAEQAGGQVMGLDMGEILSVMLDSLVYAYVEHIVSVMLIDNAIRTINPKAQVALLGMHNALEGLVLNFGDSGINLGEYVGYLVSASNLHGLGYSCVTKLTDYVGAPHVQTVAKPDSQNALAIMMDLIRNGTTRYTPTEEGYAYIADRLAQSITFKEVATPGDVDGNGTVNHIDAMLVLQYYTEVVSAGQLELAAADMNEDGIVNHIDAMLILQRYTNS